MGLKKHIYHPGNAEEHQRIGQYLRSLPPNENGYIIEVTRNNPFRSISQNKYYWAILQIISISTGEFDKDKLHRICARKFNSTIENLPKGESIVVTNSTADLDTAQFTAYVNRVKMWAREEFDIIIPEPKDMTHKLWMEIEDSYNDHFRG